MYGFFFRHVLTKFDAESVHEISFRALRAVTRFSLVRNAMRTWLVPNDPALAMTLPSIGHVAHPIGLAAGFDKNGEGYEALAALGFAFVEIGTVTAQPQSGNPRPRLFRLPKDHAIVNRMGFNNRGADAVAKNLGHHSVPLGVNIGKTKIVDEADAAADYAKSAAILAPFASYLVVNVSSPNTPGLRSLQSVEKLEPILRAVKTEVAKHSADRGIRLEAAPVFVKIAPDLADEDIDQIADLAVRLELSGIIATNTTIARSGLLSPAAEVEACGAGGLSGAPVKARSLEVLRRLYTRVGTKLVLISVGGIETADDVWARITAGASLVQTYSGFIYGGPFFVRRLTRGLGKLMRERGFAKLSDAIGSAAAKVDHAK